MFQFYQIFIDLSIDKLHIVKGVLLAEEKIQENATKLRLNRNIGGKCQT